jgi:hypothetical protein
MTQVNYNKKLRRYVKNSFISFFRQGLAKDAKRNEEWHIFISDEGRTYFQGSSYFENNYPCGLLINFEGSKNRKYCLKDLQFAVLSCVDGVNRMAFYHYSDWKRMY